VKRDAKPAAASAAPAGGAPALPASTQKPIGKQAR